MNGIMTPRNPFLDIFKGICVILVIAVHLTDRYLIILGIDRLWTGWPNLHSSLIGLLNLIFMFSVPGFLFVSGYILEIKYESSVLKYVDFMRNRLLRIIRPFFFWFIVYRAFCEPKTIKDIFRDILLLDGHFHFWFLWVISLCYAAFPLWRKLVNTKSKSDRITLIILCLLLFFWPYLVFNYIQLSIESWTVDYIVRKKFLAVPGWMFFFTAGVCYGSKVFYNFRIFLANRAKLLMLVVSTASLICLMAVFDIPRGFVGCTAAQLILRNIFIISTIVLILCVTQMIAMEKGWAVKILENFGIASMGVYLGHVAFMYIFQNIFSSILDQFGFACISLTFGSTVVSMYLLSYILSKSRFRHIMGF